MNGRTLRGLALFAALETTFADVHPFCDQVVQRGRDAIDKGKPGAPRRRACARHVASYSVGQHLAAFGVTRALGYRVPTGALLAGTALTAITHYVIDRREPLKKLMRAWPFDKGDYLDYAHVIRPISNGMLNDEGGPGTALMELDQAAHRVIGVAAALLTAWLATRAGRTGR